MRLLLALALTAFYFCLPPTLFRVPYSTVVLDARGGLLGARTADDGQWRFPPSEHVPPKLKACILCFEDKHFYRHWGVNPASIVRAAVQNLRTGHVVSGASTLTMQVIRLWRGRDRTVREKLIEMLLATRLEFRASKEEILAMYLSHAPFGGNVVGAEAAAWRYFGRSGAELSWAEAAMLAVLPNAPSMIHPGKSRPKLLAKRNRLLQKLWQNGTIDATTYALALDEPLPDAPRPLPQTAPHLVDRLQAEQRGRLVRTAIDPHLQQQVEALAERRSKEFARSHIGNLAIVVIDIETNQPVAYCGNVHYGTGRGNHNQVDILRAPRSTGSILKPFLWAAALQEGLILPHTLLPDVPVNLNGFAPQNFSQRFEGAVAADQALARSLNIPAVVLLQRYGVPKLLDLLRAAGLTTLHRSASHYGLSLILGGAEGTLYEVTQAYARMARTLLCPADSFPLQAGAVWQVMEALKQVNRPEAIDLSMLTSVPEVAWKTGTSYGFRDAWAVGITPRYAVGVWVGNAGGEGRPELTGARTAGPVLFDVVALLPRSAWFERPAKVFVEAAVCRRSGHLIGRFCDTVDTLLVLPAALRSEACGYHHHVAGQAWFSLPPVQEWYYRPLHPEYTPPPATSTAYVGTDNPPMQFIYPAPNAYISLPLQLDGTRAALTARLAHRRPASTLYWHLDNHYLGQTTHFHTLALHPDPGKHSLTVVDEAGSSLSTTFYISKPQK
ncbi:MAG: penicillin-binding protein 1C [Prevotellaceae bacterium]|jgi:penicillin-binding protein 1C|nr:penicillin-binding protein 1C [Prevotellaceae bacterium]